MSENNGYWEDFTRLDRTLHQAEVTRSAGALHWVDTYSECQLTDYGLEWVLNTVRKNHDLIMQPIKTNWGTTDGYAVIRRHFDGGGPFTEYLLKFTPAQLRSEEKLKDIWDVIEGAENVQKVRSWGLPPNPSRREFVRSY